MKLPANVPSFSQLSIRFQILPALLTLPFAYRARVVGLDKRSDPVGGIRGASLWWGLAIVDW